MNLLVTNKCLNKEIYREIETCSTLNLYSNSDASLLIPNEIAVLPTGLKLNIPNGYSALINSNYNLAKQKGLVVLQDFHGSDEESTNELFVSLINLSGKNQLIMRNEVIASMILIPIEKINVVWGD